MASDWGYSETNGPKTWAKKYPAAAGAKQSPVDIQPILSKRINVRNKELYWKYVAEHTLDITNPGYCWKVHVNGKDSELSGGPLQDRYILEQFHCHWGETDNQGSEHTINGKKYAGELHLVHWNATKYSSFEEAAKHADGLCVLGVFLKPGKRHSELEKITDLLPWIEYKGQTRKICEPINPALLLPKGSGYYTYQGSLTTPPCSECVIWIVFKEPIQVSNDQLAAFRRLKTFRQNEFLANEEDGDCFVTNNFRPTLPLGQREICEYGNCGC